MVTRRRIFFIKFSYILIDIICVGAAIYLACLLRRHTLPFEVSFHNIFLTPSNPFHIVFVVWIFTILFFNNANDLYQTRREVLEGLEFLEVTKSVFYSSLATVMAVFLLKVADFPRSILILIAVFITVFLVIWRIFKRAFVEFIVARGYNNFNVLIIGTGSVGVTLVEEIRKRPGLGLRISGYLDDVHPAGSEHGGHKVLGRVADFPDIAQREFINKVFITTHHDNDAFIQLLEQANDLNVAVRVVPQGFELSKGEFFKYNIGVIPILEYCDAENLRKQAGKRLFDFIASLSLLTVLSPLLLALAVLIKLDSPGPVFYLSRRYGRGGRQFFMYKFRSMVSDADRQLSQLKDKNEVDGPIFKIRNDPRVTPFGRFLRKYSLDELPQLINVLIGEMSLVGPRPFPIAQVEKEDLRQIKRLEVRPGMTGLWQIRGRSDISFDRLIRWDIWYINNWSFWLDWNILLQTVPVVCKGRGAY
ncbi:MAG: sugar transferase [Candidatus Omnitrophota bacterium]|nr:sugar transferase [Candidatus Omnitrophota bacterium]MDZ4241391.1 sugar transferase [Candidatus Omnitrophota bacterium]